MSPLYCRVKIRNFFLQKFKRTDLLAVSSLFAGLQKRFSKIAIRVLYYADRWSHENGSGTVANHRGNNACDSRVRLADRTDIGIIRTTITTTTTIMIVIMYHVSPDCSRGSHAAVAVGTRTYWRSTGGTVYRGFLTFSVSESVAGFRENAVFCVRQYDTYGIIAYCHHDPLQCSDLAANERKESGSAGGGGRCSLRGT